jgi:hypothetical protein
MKFVYYNHKIMNCENIKYIDAEKLLTNDFITIYYLNYELPEKVYGMESINVIMRISPGFLEGKRMRHKKYSWIFHNMIAHPIMQIFFYLDLILWGLKCMI